jgi:hydrogenase expression/formation protein HypE
VFPFAEARDPDILLGAAFGDDVALVQVGGDVLAAHMDPIVGAVEEIGWLAVHVACNDIAASGVPPRWALLLVMVPTQEDEDLLERIMIDADRAARSIGVSIIGGHTDYSSGLSRPLVAVTALGNAGGREPVRTAGAQLGDRVIVTKGIALEGTAILATDFADVAMRLGLDASDLAEARTLMREVSVLREAMALVEHGVTAMHDVTRGGLLETLLEIARLSDVGIEIDVSRVPMLDVVRRFSRAFEFDPLRMISSGTLAVTIPPQDAAEAGLALKEIVVDYAEVGVVTGGVGVTLVRGIVSANYSEIRCEEDELARLWALYRPRD